MMRAVTTELLWLPLVAAPVPVGYDSIHSATSEVVWVEGVWTSAWSKNRWFGPMWIGRA